MLKRIELVLMWVYHRGESVCIIQGVRIAYGKRNFSPLVRAYVHWIGKEPTSVKSVAEVGVGRKDNAVVLIHIPETVTKVGNRHGLIIGRSAVGCSHPAQLLSFLLFADNGLFCYFLFEKFSILWYLLQSPAIAIAIARDCYILVVLFF